MTSKVVDSQPVLQNVDPRVCAIGRFGREMDGSAPSLHTNLELVGHRLAETFEFLAVQKRFNERANKDTDKLLFDAVYARAGFWRTVNTALQVALFTGIYALLDKSKDSNATLYRALREARSVDPRLGPVLADMGRRLDTVLARYRMFRNKVFVHNDRERLKWIRKFNASNFTWRSLENDLLYLNYVYKALWRIMAKLPLLSQQEAADVSFSHDQIRKTVLNDTEEVMLLVRGQTSG